MTELFVGALANDPIVAVCGATALLLVFFAAPFRRGGVDARLVIDVFAYLATICSALKALVWVLERLNGVDSPAPTGTDLLLVTGAFGAVLTVSIQGLWASFGGRRGVPRPIGEAMTWLRAQLPTFILERSGRDVEGAPSAALAVSEQPDKEPPDREPR